MDDKEERVEYPLRVEPKEMGVVSGKEIFLTNSFLRDKLRAGFTDAGVIQKGNRRLTHIGCPFCRKGILELIKVEPIYGGGLGNPPRRKEHIGNHYEYKCLADCGAYFSGDRRWDSVD